LNKRIHTCLICGYPTETKIGLRQHNRRHKLEARVNKLGKITQTLMEFPMGRITICASLLSLLVVFGALLGVYIPMKIGLPLSLVAMVSIVCAFVGFGFGTVLSIRLLEENQFEQQHKPLEDSV